MSVVPGAVILYRWNYPGYDELLLVLDVPAADPGREARVLSLEDGAVWTWTCAGLRLHGREL